MTFYSSLIGMGAVIGLLRLARVTPKVERNSWLAAGWGIFFGSLAGARLGYCLERFTYYKGHIVEALAFWTGGFAWPGAVIGAFAAMALLSKYWKKPFLSLFDATSVLLLPLAVMAWLGAWIEGLAYGAELPLGTWWGLPAADVNGTAGLHVPVQLLAAITLLVLIGAAEIFSAKLKRAGLRGALVWFMFSGTMLGFTWLRTDPSLMLLTLRVETWFAILFSGVFFFLTLGLYFSPKAIFSTASSRHLKEIKDEPS